MAHSHEFAQAVRTSSNILALAGAGLSAASGLPTFRGAGGLWRSYDAVTLATPQAFARDPGLVWQFYAYRRHMALQVSPNPAHFALAELARQKENFVCLTQNVDGALKGFHCPRGALFILILILIFYFHFSYSSSLCLFTVISFILKCLCYSVGSRVSYFRDFRIDSVYHCIFKDYIMLSRDNNSCSTRLCLSLVLFIVISRALYLNIVHIRYADLYQVSPPAPTILLKTSTCCMALFLISNASLAIISNTITISTPCVKPSLSLQILLPSPTPT
jgi:hypothetical protein